MELMQANAQWSNRPDDQKFLSLPDMFNFAHSIRARSSSRVVNTRDLHVSPAQDNSKELCVTGPNGGCAYLNHYAFGQLSTLGGAPAGYLRTLPAEMAADNINYSLRFNREPESVGVLLTADEGYGSGKGRINLRAATGPNYGRVWNETVISALMQRFGNGVDGEFRVPVEFGAQSHTRDQMTKENTTLYASDRDMFVFLADETNRIELPNRRDGKTGTLARGFFVYNSEVGAGKLGIATFLFDYMCGNHIVWGAEEFNEVSIRHTAAAPAKWLEQMAPAIEAYAHGSARGVTQQLLTAQSTKVDDVEAFLKNRYTRTEISGIKAAHIAEEQRPIETVWDVVTGATAYAKNLPHMNERIAVEREAGRILDKMAA